MANFFTSSAFYLTAACVFVALGLLQVRNSIIYSKGILKNGTDNGFAPMAMWFSAVFGVGLVLTGILSCLIGLGKVVL